ncbi:MAG: hypothetical protein HQ541_04920 [Mariniphaga sp.]|nr:hypothetical protein [Mariniphaga sp.]
MKKLALLICLSIIFVNVYGNDPLKLRKKNSENKSAISDISFSANNENYPIWGYFINVAPSYSNVFSKSIRYNIDLLTDVDDRFDGNLIDLSSNLGFSFNAGYFRSLNSKLKFKAGFGIDLFSVDIKNKYLITNTKNFNATDIDKIDTVNVEFTFNENTFTDSILSCYYFSLPLVLEYGYTNLDKLSFYVDLGVNFSMRIKETKVIEFYTEGTYAKYDGVILNGVPELGFYGKIENEKREWEVVNTNTFNIALLGGAGITYPITNNYILKVGVVTNFGLNNAFSDFLENRLDNVGIEFGLYINKLFN